MAADMRLLKRLPDGEVEMTSVYNDNPPQYAILSHTWNEGQEVTYNELLTGTGKDKTGYAKIRFCMDRAAQDGIDYAWVDTCCIERSHEELQRAINSMFRWYQGATKCYVYLSDVEASSGVGHPPAIRTTWIAAFRRSRWFTRGWTLQELLAPSVVEFFSKEGIRLGDKLSLEYDIHKITRIPIEALRGQPLSDFSIEQRMDWCARRTTTVKEDKVYCLLGIFGVHLVHNYGEGEKYAFSRLEDEIRRRQALEEEAGEDLWQELLETRQFQNRCRNCGSPKHWERYCEEQQCGKCRKYGHKASYCRNPVRCIRCKRENHMAGVCPKR